MCGQATSKTSSTFHPSGVRRLPLPTACGTHAVIDMTPVFEYDPPLLASLLTDSGRARPAIPQPAGWDAFTLAY